MENDELDVFEGVGVEVKFEEKKDFLKIMETLTRIGVASKKDNTLFQSCHILHKRGRYAILHFKELFLLDGKDAEIEESDYARRNTIVNLLEEWKLLTKVRALAEDAPFAPISQIKIIHHSEKDEWRLLPKYTIGSRKKIVNQTND